MQFWQENVNKFHCISGTSASSHGVLRDVSVELDTS